MKEIYEKDTLYTVLRPYVDWCCKYSYRKTAIAGEENIPEDGSIILTPNHTNTLMDALVMLRAYKGPTVFGARADIFKKPAIARIMHFLRILPMVRQRDGLRNVLKNHESTEKIVDTLENGVRFCIFPEGKHRTMHSLLPFGKGALRAALAANARFGEAKPVYIVPVGIEYGDWFRYRSTCLITYGEPINVTEFVKDLHPENEAQVFEPLKKELSGRMSALITYIKDDESYEGKWALTKILSAGAPPKGLHVEMVRKREILAGIETACSCDPDTAAGLVSRAEKFGREMKAKKLSFWSASPSNSAARASVKGIAAIAMLPYFILCALASLPMWATFIGLKKKIKDKAFRNTAGFGIKLAMGPLVFMIWTVTAFCLLNWPLALVLSILTIPSYSFFHDYCEFVRRWISDIRYLADGSVKNECDAIRKQAEALTGHGKSENR